jgi:pimeloyl-ACP methyl ester carboxylesterase
MQEQIRFCSSSDGTRLAYTVSGEGPPLIKAQSFIGHLEHDWNSPVWRHWLAALSRRFSLVRFDQRGCGLSDADVADISFEGWVRDLEAVADASGFERFAMLGVSQGAALAIAYAARHPERVSHLLLCGGYARGWARRDLPPARLEWMQTLAKLIELGWGTEDPAFRQVFSTEFMPDASAEQLRSFNEMMRLSTSAGMAVRIYRAFGEIDVQAEARQVSCPTLVLHVRGDLRAPFEEGRLIAGLIPGAQFVPLDGRNHILLEGEPAWQVLLDAIDRFLPPERASSSAFAGLTGRERDVLELIAQGLDNAQIAAHLELSGKTVRNHITHVFDKIHVENRAQAIVRARDAGFGKGTSRAAP